MTRGSAQTGPSHPRFRCRICKEFVHGTEAGYCPRCGEPPPSIDVMPRESPRPVLAILVLVGIVVIAAAWLVARS